MAGFLADRADYVKPSSSIQQHESGEKQALEHESPRHEEIPPGIELEEMLARALRDGSASSE